jgi:hypothetical protein
MQCVHQGQRISASREIQPFVPERHWGTLVANQFAQ